MSKTKIFCDARICYRADTLANWLAEDPVLLAGEKAIITDGATNKREKVGDGATPFSKLPFSYECGTGKETSAGGEIHNDYASNRAEASYCSVFGSNNVCGKSGFYIYDVNAAEKTLQFFSASGLTEGTVCSAFINVISPSGKSRCANFDNFGTVKSVKQNERGIYEVQFSAIPLSEGEHLGYGSFIWASYKSDVGDSKVGNNAFAVGSMNQALHDNTFAGGYDARALGPASFAFGNMTRANGEYSATFGMGTVTNGPVQMALGKYNALPDGALLCVGNGEYEQESNALTVFGDGTAQIGKTGENENSIVTRQYVDSIGSRLVLDSSVSPTVTAPRIFADADNSGNPLNIRRAKIAIAFKLLQGGTGAVKIITDSNTIAYLDSAQLNSNTVYCITLDVQLYPDSSGGYIAVSNYSSKALECGDFSLVAPLGEGIKTSVCPMQSAISQIGIEWIGDNIADYRIMIWE